MIYLVGPFPPPMHGMGFVNQSIKKLLQKRNADYVIFDTSGKLEKSIAHYFIRFMNFPIV